MPERGRPAAPLVVGLLLGPLSMTAPADAAEVTDALAARPPATTTPVARALTARPPAATTPAARALTAGPPAAATPTAGALTAAPLASASVVATAPRPVTAAGLATPAAPISSATAAAPDVRVFAALQDWRDYRAARQAGDVEAVDVHLIYAGGRLEVTESETPLLYDARLRYDADRWVPRRTWRMEDGTWRFRMALGDRDEAEAEDEGDDLSEFELNLESLPRDANESGRLSLALHPSVPMRLNLGVGAGRARLNLGGLSLREVEFVTAVSDARVSFARENRVPMELLAIKSGATGFTGEQLGNARFERLSFQGVVGDVLLDFSGSWESSATAEVEMVLGELVMRVPADIGVRVRRSGLGTFSAEDLRKTDGGWVSPNWDRAPVQLDIEVTAGIASVRVERL